MHSNSGPKENEVQLFHQIPTILICKWLKWFRHSIHFYVFISKEQTKKYKRVGEISPNVWLFNLLLMIPLSPLCSFKNITVGAGDILCAKWPLEGLLLRKGACKWSFKYAPGVLFLTWRQCLLTADEVLQNIISGRFWYSTVSVSGAKGKAAHATGKV